MNLAKSIYISAFSMLAMAIVGYAGFAAKASQEWIAWAAVGLTVMPFLGFVGWAMLARRIARTSAHFPVLHGLGVVGVLLAGWRSFGGHVSALAPLLAVVGLVGFAVYALWYSHLSRSPSPALTVGKPLPKFELTSSDGSRVSSSTIASQPTILLFYRGNWCPLCMAQIKEIAGLYRRLESLGVRVWLISPQPAGHSKSLAKKFDAPMDFLVDEGNRAARALGIAQDHGVPLGMGVLGYDSETVLPTVVITDAHGKIIWKNETDNYRVRPEPETFLAALSEAGVIDAVPNESHAAAPA